MISAENFRASSSAKANALVESSEKSVAAIIVVNVGTLRTIRRVRICCKGEYCPIGRYPRVASRLQRALNGFFRRFLPKFGSERTRPREGLKVRPGNRSGHPGPMP